MAKKKILIKKENMIAITNAITGEMETAKVTMIVQKDSPKYFGEPFTLLFQAGNRAMSRGITPAAAKLILFLCSIVDYNNSIPLSRTEIASEIGYSARQIDRALQELIKLNIVLVEKHVQDKRSTQYYINPLQSWKGKPKERAKRIAEHNPNQLQMFDDVKKKLIEPNLNFDSEK